MYLRGIAWGLRASASGSAKGSLFNRHVLVLGGLSWSLKAAAEAAAAQASWLATYEHPVADHRPARVTPHSPGGALRHGACEPRYVSNVGGSLAARAAPPLAEAPPLARTPQRAVALPLRKKGGALRARLRGGGHFIGTGPSLSVSSGPAGNIFEQLRRQLEGIGFRSYRAFRVRFRSNYICRVCAAWFQVRKDARVHLKCHTLTYAYIRIAIIHEASPCFFA